MNINSISIESTIPNYQLNSSGMVVVKLCPEDKEQLDRIESKLEKLSKKKEFVQLRIKNDKNC